jgi:hypothetical protein
MSSCLRVGVAARLALDRARTARKLRILRYLLSPETDRQTDTLTPCIFVWV